MAVPVNYSRRIALEQQILDAGLHPWTNKPLKPLSLLKLEAVIDEFQALGGCLNGVGISLDAADLKLAIKEARTVSKSAS